MARAKELLEEQLDAGLRGGTGLQALNWSEQDYQALGQLAAQTLQAGRNREAKHLYALLCRLDPLAAEGFLGLGACCQNDSDYAKAVSAYGQAAILDLDDPRPSFHAAQCLFQLGQFRKAAHALSAAKAQAKAPEHRDLRKKIVRLAAAVREFETKPSTPGRSAMPNRNQPPAANPAPDSTGDTGDTGDTADTGDTDRMDAFLAQQKAEQARGQETLKTLAAERGINLEGVHALEIEYARLNQVPKEPALQTLERLQRRQQDALTRAHDVSRGSAARVRGRRRTPLRPI